MAALLLTHLIFASLANADYQSGLDAYNAGRYDVAMREWLLVADRPPGTAHPAIYAETFYAIGMLYWMGQGVTKDYYQASKWLHQAGDLGHAGAQLKLGFMYSEAVAVQPDYVQAFEWFDRAAKQGEVDAQYNLGLYYLNGWGTEQDKTMAAQWFSAASAQGDEEAERQLQELLPELAATPIQAAAATPTQAAAATPTQAAAATPTQAAAATPTQAAAATPIQAAAATPIPEPAATNTQARHPGPSSRHPGPGSRHPGPGSRHPGPGSRHPGLDPGSIEPTPPATDILTPAWIRAQNPEHYTIQVIGLRERERIESIIKGHENLAPFAIYTVQRKKLPLHVLVQGVYPDVDSARKARDQFPRAIQKNDELWIRRFAMVQAAMQP